MRALLAPLPEGERAVAWKEAARIADEDVAINASYRQTWRRDHPRYLSTKNTRSIF